MSDATATYERAIATFKQVTANLTADDLDKQSPCASWKVRDVIDHLVQGADFFVPSVGGDASGPIEGDPNARFDAASQRILDAFNQPGALDNEVDLPFGRMPASVLVGIATTDTFTHAWDVAKATGQSTDLDPEFATELLARAQTTIPDAMRGEDGVAMFGPKREAPAGASTADQLAAFLGREV
ncbi:MAG: TIGR03086 family metal-binding protein [Acidimicrobiales bacterium]|nr:TIGR03086 family metal-binding protein [Acidimicrobiales bacterium]